VDKVEAEAADQEFVLEKGRGGISRRAPPKPSAERRRAVANTPNI